MFEMIPNSAKLYFMWHSLVRWERMVDIMYDPSCVALSPRAPKTFRARFSFIRLYSASKGIGVVICGDQGSSSGLVVTVISNFHRSQLLLSIETSLEPSLRHGAQPIWQCDETREQNRRSKFVQYCRFNATLFCSLHDSVFADCFGLS